jgi:hypothetical protein
MSKYLVYMSRTRHQDTVPSLAVAQTMGIQSSGARSTAGLDLTNHGERLRRHYRGEIEPYLPARIRQDGVVRQAAGTRHHPRGFPSRGADQDRHRVATSSRPHCACRSRPDDMVLLPAAGLPWLLAPFGRDSLIVSLQNLLIHPAFRERCTGNTRVVSGARAGRVP